MSLQLDLVAQNIAPNEQLTKVRFDEEMLQFILHDGNLLSSTAGTKVPIEEIENFEVQTEESIEKLSSGLGWAAAGLVVAGPVGGILGALLGRKKTTTTKICFAANLKDGRKFLAVADAATFQKLQVAAF